MSIWSSSPVYKINNFISAKLREENIIPSVSNYITELSGIDGDVQLSFIIPSQQMADISTPYDSTSLDLDGFIDLPFASYTMTIEGLSDRSYLTCGQISYIFYTSDIEKLVEIVNYTIDLCKREEYSAADLNDYLESDSSNPFDFKSLSVQNAVGPMEAETSGGRHAFLVVIAFDCTYDLISTPDNSSGPFSGKKNMWH